MSTGNMVLGGLVILLRMRRRRKAKDKAERRRRPESADGYGDRFSYSEPSDLDEETETHTRYLTERNPRNDGPQLRINYFEEGRVRGEEWYEKSLQELVISERPSRYKRSSPPSAPPQHKGYFGPVPLPPPPYSPSPQKTQGSPITPPTYLAAPSPLTPRLLLPSPPQRLVMLPPPPISPSPPATEKICSNDEISPSPFKDEELAPQNCCTSEPPPIPGSPSQLMDECTTPRPPAALRSTENDAPSYHFYYSSQQIRLSFPEQLDCSSYPPHLLSPEEPRSPTQLPPPPPISEPTPGLLWGGRHPIFVPPDEDPFFSISHLGHGSVGAVDEVRETLGSIICVRKKVSLAHHQREEKLKIIQEETKVLKSLNHIHIVKYLGSYEVASHPERPATYCLLMSPVGDNDLHAFLNQCAEQRHRGEPVFGTRWLRKWFTCLPSALGYIHDQGIRHGDIKPSNIIHRGGSIYLTDFSSSSLIDGSHTTSTFNSARATARYAAPEVADRVRSDGTLQKHGRGSDIFALGCVFCEMLTVMLHESVASFHSFLLTNHNGEASGKLLYRHKVDAISEWFSGSWEGRTLFDRGYSPFEFFDGCIRPMLSANRMSRPNATSVRLKMSVCTYRAGASVCSCSF